MSNATCSIRKTACQGGVVVEVSGSIDESLSADELVVNAPLAVFDLGGIERVTSGGILEWTKGLAKVTSTYYCFINVPPSVVVQFNMVSIFGQRGELLTFRLPFVCPSCDETIEPLVDLRTDYDSMLSDEFAPVICMNCGVEAEFDDYPPLYLAHVRRMPKPAPPAAIHTLVDGPRLPVQEQPLSIQKEIRSNMTCLTLAGSLSNERSLRRLAQGLGDKVLLVVGTLESISTGGTRALREFFRNCEAAIYVGNVPFRLLPQLEAAATATRAQIVSILCPAVCSSCSWRGDIMLDANTAATAQEGGAFAEALGEPSGVLPCLECGEPLDEAGTLDRVRHAASLALQPMPPSVRSILEGTFVNPDDDSAGAPVPTPSGLVAGKYELLDSLGVGGMGEVFLSRQIGIGGFEKMVVIKKIRHRGDRAEEAVRLFLQEARITALLTHPNIVQIFDIGQDEGEYYIAMEYVEGMDLCVALDTADRAGFFTPISVACQILADVCSALEQSHSFRQKDGTPTPIYHRDVSPANILISHHGTVKLTDFGVAKLSDTNEENTGFKGKFSYAAPERLVASGSADGRMDVYSAGIVLFETVTLRRLVNCKTASMEDYRPDIPRKLQRIVDRAIHAVPDHRFQSAAEMRRALLALRREIDPNGSETVEGWQETIRELRAQASVGATAKDEALDHTQDTVVSGARMRSSSDD